MVNKATVFYVSSGRIKVCIAEKGESFINVYPDCGCDFGCECDNPVEYYLSKNDLLKFKEALDFILQEEVDIEADS